VDEVRTIVSVAAALVMAGSLAWVSYVVAVGLCPRASASERLSSALIIAAGALLVGFEVLTACGLFRLDVALALLVAGLLATFYSAHLRHDAASQANGDFKDVTAALWGRGDHWLRLATLAVFGVATMRLVRGLASPPLGYDALTYHLARAATWLQTGAQQRFLAPDAWGYMTYYPAAGDALSAWAMLPTSNDLLLAPAGAVIWGAVLLGMHASARALGATSRAAVLSALAVGSLPCVLPHLTAAYVDLPALAALLNGFAQMVCFARNGGRVSAVLGVIGLAFAAATRSSALPWLAAGLPAIVLIAWFRRNPSARRDRAGTVAACLLASLVAFPTYAAIWAETGSPFYPMEVSLPWLGVLAGNHEFLSIHSGQAFGLPPIPTIEIVQALFLPDVESATPHLNLGPAAPFMLILGALGSIALLRRGPRMPAVLGLLVIASVVLGTFVWAGSAGFLKVPWWLDKIGRFLMPGLAIAVVLGSVVAVPAANALRLAAIGVGTWLSFPLGWSDASTNATLQVVAILVAAIAMAIGLAGILARRRHPFLAASVATLIVLLATAAIEVVRQPARYPIWEAASQGVAWDLHPGNNRCLSAWPIWKELDRPLQTSIALTAGFDGIGHNWHTYPLFGSRLQNRVQYVPVAHGGRIVDYSDQGAVEAQADPVSWLAGLDAGNFEVLVALWPDPPESLWAEKMPDVFKPLVTTPGGTAWSIDRKALENRLHF
jgi:hypothetical protein